MQLLNHYTYTNASFLWHSDLSMRNGLENFVFNQTNSIKNDCNHFPNPPAFEKLLLKTVFMARAVVAE